jgi:hypothetical protein
MKTYSLSTPWLIFILMGCGLMVLGFTFALTFIAIPALLENPASGRDWFLLIIALLLITFSIYGIVEGFKGRVRMEADRISLSTARSTKELSFAEIKGYRLDDKYIYILPISKKGKPLKISRYFRDMDEIIDWLSANYPDLDSQEKERQQELILEDLSYGMTRELRQSALAKAKVVARVVNVLSVLTGLALIFVPGYVHYSAALAIALPFIILIVMRASKGLIRMEQKSNSPHPSVSWGFFAIILCMLLKYLHYQVLDYSGVWLPALGASLVLFVLLVIKNPAFEVSSRADFFGVLFIAVITFAYGFAAVLAVNCDFDEGPAQRLTAKVLDKRISGGKSTTYYLTLSPWGKLSAPEEVSVSRNEYERATLNQTVYPYLLPGKLKIPWFVVSLD